MAIRIKLSRVLGEVRWSQKDLHEATGVRAATINEYYNELTNRINIEHFNLFCEALRCDLGDLLEYSPDRESKVKKCVPKIED